MIQFDHTFLIFHCREVWFAPEPYDIVGADKLSFKNCSEKLDLDDHQREDFTTLSIDLTRPLEDISADCSKTCRYHIRKAESAGITVKKNTDYTEFIDMYDAFTRQKGIAKSIATASFLKDNGILYTAYLNDRLIAGTYFLADEDQMRLWINASIRLAKDDSIKPAEVGYANRATIWHAVEDGKASGIKELDLGGYYTGDEPDPEKEGVSNFKAGFTKNVVTKYHYTKYVSPLMKFASGLKQLVN